MRFGFWDLPARLLPSAAAATAATTTTTTTAAAPAEAAPSAARLLRARFIDRQRPAAEAMLVQLADGILRVLVGRHFHEGEPARATGFPVERPHDLGGWADLSEVRTQVVFGCLIGQIAHEQSDWWHGVNSNE